MKTDILNLYYNGGGKKKQQVYGRADPAGPYGGAEPFRIPAQTLLRHVKTG